MKRLTSIVCALLVVGGLAGSSMAAEHAPTTPSAKTIAMLLLVAESSGSTGVIVTQP
jgi:hypothetical protein